MRRAKIPTIIGLIILVLGLATGVFLIGNRQIFKLGATEQASPRDVRISNISSSSFSISWTTDIETTGFVTYGEKSSDLSDTQKEESSSPGFTHLVRFSGLKPETQYFLKINSGGNTFDNNGVPWQGETGPILPEPAKPSLISGSILTTTSTPARGALVYISINGTLLSTLTSQNGSWLISIPFAVDEVNTLLEISVQAGPSGISSAQIYPQSAKPVPTMILGQTYDFKNLAPSQESDMPQATFSPPEESTPSSGFDIPETITTPSAKTVTLENIKDGEIVTSTKPELLGKGPAGTTISITVESDPVSGEVTVPNSGEWNWEVPKNLPEGVHKITIVWKDASGVNRTLIRNFVVQAAEGPAFEATPSATPQVTPSASPTATPGATATSSATPKATLPPTPESGSLTPTILLSIMSVGFIAFSFLFWKESNA